MQLSCNQTVSILDHIILVVFNQLANSPISLALTLAGLDTIHDFLGIDNGNINDLSYVDKNATEQTLSLSHHDMFRAFSAFFIYRVQNSIPIGYNWLGIMCDEYDDFHASAAYLAMQDFLNPTDVYA